MVAPHFFLKLLLSTHARRVSLGHTDRKNARWREHAISELHHGLAQIGVRLEAVHKLIHVDRAALWFGGKVWLREVRTEKNSKSKKRIGREGRTNLVDVQGVKERADDGGDLGLLRVGEHEVLGLLAVVGLDVALVQRRVQQRLEARDDLVALELPVVVLVKEHERAAQLLLHRATVRQTHVHQELTQLCLCDGCKKKIEDVMIK